MPTFRSRADYALSYTTACSRGKRSVGDSCICLEPSKVGERKKITHVHFPTPFHSPDRHERPPRKGNGLSTWEATGEHSKRGKNKDRGLCRIALHSHCCKYALAQRLVVCRRQKTLGPSILDGKAQHDPPDGPK